MAIPSLVWRHALLSELLGVLMPQVDALDRGVVEVLVDQDNATVSIGAKMQRLNRWASGSYVAVVADDDLVADDYVKQLLSGIAAGPDCVTFRLARFEDGRRKASVVERSSMELETQPGPHYPTWLHPLTCRAAIRRSICTAFAYPDISIAEDAAFSRYVVGLNPVCEHVQQELYISRYRHDDPHGAAFQKALGRG